MKIYTDLFPMNGRVNAYMLRAGLGQPFLVGSGFGKFPLKIPHFSIFSPSVKKKNLRVWSKRQVSLLFTAGQNKDGTS